MNMWFERSDGFGAVIEQTGDNEYVFTLCHNGKVDQMTCDNDEMLVIYHNLLDTGYKIVKKD